MKVHIRAGISFVLLVALVAFVAFLVVHPYLLGIAPSPFAKEEISLEEGWTTEDGTSVSLNDLGSIPGFAQDGATIQLRLPSSIPSQAELNFVSSNLTLHLYYDGEEAYAFDPVHSPTEHPYATHFNFAPLSVNDAGKLARLELRPAYTDMNARLVSVRIAETSAYIQDYVTSHGFALIESLVTIFIGFTVIAFDIVLRKIKHGQLDLLALGSAIILMGIWSITVTKVFQLITGQEALVGALE